MAKVVDIGISPGSAGLERIVGITIAETVDNAYGIDSSGATNQRDALYNAIAAVAATVPSGDPCTLYLPPGKIRIDGITSVDNANTGNRFPLRGGIVIPSGMTIMGHPGGTEIIWKSAVATGQLLFQMGDRTQLCNIKMRRDSSNTYAGYDGVYQLVFGLSVKDVVVRDCEVLAGDGNQDKWLNPITPISFWGCDRVAVKGTVARYSVGASYGIEVIGGNGILIEDSDVSYNGWDGIKVHANQSYGTPTNLVIRNCRMDFNGYAITRDSFDPATVMGAATGATVYTSDPAWSAGQVPAHGSKIVLNYASSGTFTLPNSPGDGRQILISKRMPTSNITGHNVTIQPGGGTTWTMESTTFSRGDVINVGARTLRLGLSIDLNHDFNLVPGVVMLTAKQGTNTWQVNAWGNGEGFDGTALIGKIDGCSTSFNQGAGIQVKPVWTRGLQPPNRCSDFLVTDCKSIDNYAHGFGVFITLAGDTSIGATGPPSNLPAAYPSPRVTGVSFRGCLGLRNRGNGFSAVNSPETVTQPYCYGLTVEDCVFRSNVDGGIVVQPGFHDVLLRRLQVVGNCAYYHKTGGTFHGAAWGAFFHAPVGLTLDDIVFMGVDPIEQSLTDAQYTWSGGLVTVPSQIDAATPYCWGIGIQRGYDGATINGGTKIQSQTMSRCKFSNIRFRNILGNQTLRIYTSDTNSTDLTMNSLNMYGRGLLIWDDYFDNAGILQIPQDDGEGVIIVTIPYAGMASGAMKRFIPKMYDIDILGIAPTLDANPLPAGTRAVPTTLSVDEPNATATWGIQLQDSSGTPLALHQSALVKYRISRN